MEKKICSYCNNELSLEDTSCPKCLTAYEKDPVNLRDQKVVLYKNNRNYVTGIIGGLIGGLIASIPWYFIEVYTGIISAYLAFVIAYGVKYGYKLCHGKLDKVYPLAVSIIPFIVVLLLEFVFIPMHYFNQENISYSFSLVMYIMTQGTSLFWLAVTLLFTFLGTRQVVNEAKAESID